jgi:hypothetical protein
MRMIRWFQFHEWSLADRTSMHVCLQKERFSIKWEGRAEPAKVWWFVFSTWSFPHFCHPLEVCLAYRSPHTPHKRPWPIQHWNLQAAPNKDFVLVNHAEVRGQFATSFPFILWNRIIRYGCICSEVHRKFSGKLATIEASVLGIRHSNNLAEGNAYSSSIENEIIFLRSLSFTKTTISL